MTLIQSLLTFAAAATVLTMTPGVDTAVVLRTATGGGPRPAMFAALGIGLGCLIWGGAVALGLGALLVASQTAYTIVKWAGAAYLLWLGLGLLLRPRRSAPIAGGVAGGARQALGRGLLTNLLNSKIGVFYISFLPQFVPAGANVGWVFSFGLACIHVLLGLLWFAVLIAATLPLGRWLARPHVIAALDRLTGGVFLAFGVKLILSRPH